MCRSRTLLPASPSTGEGGRNPQPGLEQPGCLNLCKVELISHYHMILEQPTSLLQPMCKIHERSYEEHMEKHLQAQTSTYSVSCRKSQSHPREGDHKRGFKQKQTVLCMFFSSQKHAETEAFPKHMPCIFAPAGSLKAARWFCYQGNSQNYSCCVISSRLPSLPSQPGCQR